eukprot:TRINITY_DN15429_c0_g1_i1.p1 TRINITY_DN15429_c0_g1~~TRINITY_DN15429_c0_g1_i1.p1  ORF type:complete len:438 (-),score=26.20 TRINITY_DN15429_c0_g1_i1:272-1585(-)
MKNSSEKYYGYDKTRHQSKYTSCSGVSFKRIGLAQDKSSEEVISLKRANEDLQEQVTYLEQLVDELKSKDDKTNLIQNKLRTKVKSVYQQRQLDLLKQQTKGNVEVLLQCETTMLDFIERLEQIIPQDENRDFAGMLTGAELQELFKCSKEYYNRFQRCRRQANQQYMSSENQRDIQIGEFSQYIKRLINEDCSFDAVNSLDVLLPSLVVKLANLSSQDTNQQVNLQETLLLTGQVCRIVSYLCTVVPSCRQEFVKVVNQHLINAKQGNAEGENVNPLNIKQLSKQVIDFIKDKGGKLDNKTTKLLNEQLERNFCVERVKQVLLSKTIQSHKQQSLNAIDDLYKQVQTSSKEQESPTVKQVRDYGISVARIVDSYKQFQENQDQSTLEGLMECLENEVAVVEKVPALLVQLQQSQISKKNMGESINRLKENIRRQKI